MRLLGRLDSRVLPRLGRGCARILGRSVAADAELAPAVRSRVVRRARLAAGVAGLAAFALLVGGGYFLRDTNRDRGNSTVTHAAMHVGAAQGQQITSYLDDARARLSQLTTSAPVYALVSFGDYANPATTAETLQGITTCVAIARVPLSDRQTEIVKIPVVHLPVDVTNGMQNIAMHKQDQATAAARTAQSLTGGGKKEIELRTFYETNAQVLRDEADNYQKGCRCVYAAVVRATPTRLAGLAKRPGVRVVDPAPALRRSDQAVFLPVLPEQRDKVDPLPDSALPKSK